MTSSFLASATIAFFAPFFCLILQYQADIRDSVGIYKDILKFTLSSFSSFVLDYLLFSLFMFLFPHTAAWVLGANILARMVSAFYNYSMNCSFVFHTRRKVETAAQYFMLAVFILCVNNVILEGFIRGVGFSVYLAKEKRFSGWQLIFWQQD